MLKLVVDNKARGFTITDFKAMRRELGKIEPSLRREFDKNLRTIVKPGVDAIKKAIPSTPPLYSTKRGKSGFDHNGRTGWNSGNPRQVKIYKPRGGGTRGKLTTTLVGLRMMSAAASIADMAGRSGAYFGGKGVTRVYQKNGKKVTHKISVNSGREFSRLLSSYFGRGASRIGFPTIEKHIVELEKAIDKVLNDAYHKLNGKLFN